MLKKYTVSVEDNGAAFLVVVNGRGDDRLVVAAERSLGDAWRKIKWMHEIESQEFCVRCAKRDIPVSEWIEMMKNVGVF